MSQSANKLDYDVVVVGAGVTGLSIAYYLASQRRVLVLERESQPAYHSSGRSAAVYIRGYENAVVAELTAASAGFFFDPPQALTEQALLHPRGGLSVVGRGDEALLSEHFSTWRGNCPNMQQVSIEQALARVPVLRKEWLGGALWDPDYQSIDVHELLTVFQRGIKGAGGRVQCSAEITAANRRSDHWELSTAKGDLTTGIVVNAAGAWADSFAARAGLGALGISPKRRTAAIVPVADATHWPLVHVLSGGLYFKPESPGLMLSPEDEIPSEPVDAFADDLDVAKAIHRLQTVTTLAVTRVHHQWAGLRSFAPDRFPVVGFDPRADGFFWLAGQGGFGVQTAPGLGQRAAALVLEQRPVDRAIDVARLL